MSTLRARTERKRGIADIKAEEQRPLTEALNNYDATIKEGRELKRKLLLERKNDEVFGHLRKEYGELNPLVALNAAEEFMATTPKYFRTESNAAALSKVFLLNELAPTANNYQFVYEVLTEAGLLARAPKKQAKVESEPEPEKPRFNGTERTTPPDPNDPTDSLSAEEYRRKVGLRRVNTYAPTPEH